jgi:hypothetical protein
MRVAAWFFAIALIVAACTVDGQPPGDGAPATEGAGSPGHVDGVGDLRVVYEG